MPPKQRVVVQSSSPPQQSAGSYIKGAYNQLTDPENASVVRSVVIFGAAVAFLQSSFSDVLLPAL